MDKTDVRGRVYAFHRDFFRSDMCQLLLDEIDRGGGTQPRAISFMGAEDKPKAKGGVKTVSDFVALAERHPRAEYFQERVRCLVNCLNKNEVLLQEIEGQHMSVNGHDVEVLQATFRMVFRLDGYIYKFDFRDNCSDREILLYLGHPNEVLTPIEYIEYTELQLVGNSPDNPCLAVVLVFPAIEYPASENEINDYINFDTQYAQYIWPEWDCYEENKDFPECSYIQYDGVRIDDAHIHNFRRAETGEIFMIDYTEVDI